MELFEFSNNYDHSQNFRWLNLSPNKALYFWQFFNANKIAFITLAKNAISVILYYTEVILEKLFIVPLPLLAVLQKYVTKAFT